MSGKQHEHLRLFIEERLTAAALEIFGVVEKTISEYEDQVVQLKQDLMILNTLKPHLQQCNNTVSEDLHLNRRPDLRSTQEDHSLQVKEEQVDLSHVPDCEAGGVFNSRTNGFVTSESTSDIQLIIPPYTDITVQQCPQVKEGHSGLGIVTESESSIYSSGTNGFFTSESTGDSHLISPYTNETVQQCPQVKEEQLDLCIVPESSVYNNTAATKGFVSSESSGDSQLIPRYATETATTSHDVVATTRGNETIDGSLASLTFSQKNADMYCIEQKICRFCRKQFRSYSHLKRHVEESHKGQRAFKCPECQKEFARRDKFSIHYRIHTGEKRHSCPVCGRLFTQRSNCIIHMRTHTGVKPHSCPVCRKLFAQSSSLNLHMRTHTGVKPHSCPLCGKTFAASSALTVHMRIHTDVRPYSCSVCGKEFNQNANLKVHLRTHTGRGPGPGRGEAVGEHQGL